jgi:hypothetical protein
VLCDGGFLQGEKPLLFWVSVVNQISTNEVCDSTPSSYYMFNSTCIIIARTPKNTSLHVRLICPQQPGMQRYILCLSFLGLHQGWFITAKPNIERTLQIYGQDQPLVPNSEATLHRQHISESSRSEWSPLQGHSYHIAPSVLVSQVASLGGMAWA